MMRINDEHDIFRMGGLRRALPMAYYSFLIGAASLAALPLVTAGFYSKDMILWGAFNSRPGGPLLWCAGLLGALLTPIYIFRAVFVVFFGERHTQPRSRYGARIVVPLAILSLLALTAGFVNLPPALGNLPVFSNLLGAVLPVRQELATARSLQGLVMAVTALIALLGVAIAWWIYGRRACVPARLLTRPFLWFARVNHADLIDAFYAGLAAASRLANRALSATVDGRLRRYA